MAGAVLWQLEQFQPGVLLGFVRNLLPDSRYIGDTLLPPETIDDVEYEYIKGVRDTPVMAHIIGWDSESPMAGRPALGERVKGELPPIKRKSRMSEKEIIRRYMQPRRGSADQQNALRKVYADLARHVASIQARTEWLQIQSITEDTLVYDEDGVIIEFDYGVPDVQQITLGATAGSATNGTGATVAAYGPRWSDTANATPISDLMTLTRQVTKARGERPTRMLMSEKTFDYLLVNAQIKGWLFPSDAPDRPLLPEEVLQLLTRYRLPQPILYDVEVLSENPDGTTTSVRTMRENAVTLLPQQPVGRRLIGPTAESMALIGTPYAAQAPGIWGAVWGTDEPPQGWTKAAAVTFPTLPDVDKIGQMTVWV